VTLAEKKTGGIENAWSEIGFTFFIEVEVDSRPAEK
jgi:hypothetical protein